MAAATKTVKMKGQLDVWSVQERLALACSVMRSGDQNWVSVSRAIKPYGDRNRHADWFSQKNCAMQYSDLLEKVEKPKRKRGDRGEIDTPGIQIVRNLAIERIEELKKKVVEQQQRYKKLKKDVECIKSGQLDDWLPEYWEQMQNEKKTAEEAIREAEKAAEEARAQALAASKLVLPTMKQLPLSESRSSLSEADESTQDSIEDKTTDDDSSNPTPSIDLTAIGDTQLTLPTFSQDASLTCSSAEQHLLPGTSSDQPQKVPPTSQLLSSLLQSKMNSVDGLQQIKQEAELQAATQITPVPDPTNQTREAPTLTLPKILPPAEAVPSSPSTAAPTLSKLLGTPAAQSKAALTTTAVTSLPADALKGEKQISIKQEKLEEDIEKPGDTSEPEPSSKESVTVTSPAKDLSDLDRIKREQPVSEEDLESVGTPSNSFLSVDEEISIKEEPPSPASSVSSRVSESGGRSNRPRGRGRKSKGSKRIPRFTRRSQTDDDKKDDASSKPSDAESSDDDGAPESDDTLSMIASQAPMSTANSALSESIPNSPLSHCSDTEDEKAYKTWKKSIMLVWRAAANHKYANVFLHPVTDDIAPGYRVVVLRPMDLSTIKKNIESGIIRTTAEFQRDMMLMFTNAVMYNSSNHNVYKMATEMYEDVMQHIEQYVSTQLMVQSKETHLLRASRRSDNSDKEDDAKRRRLSSEQSLEGGKTKRRKTRADDT